MVLNDEWLSAAIADDNVVVDLLIRLKQSQASSSSSIKSPVTAVIPSRWGLRQRRSRVLSSIHKNKESSSTRCSPTTPLSWSGGDTSPSADGFEHSSHPSSRFSHSSRSKGYGTNELSCSTTAMAKKLKRRKALVDLRVEESLLLKEREHFKKTNLNFDTSTNSVLDESKPVVSNQPCQSVDPTADNVLTTLPIQTVPENSTQSESIKTQEINSMEIGGFLLPDLNMMPAEDCL